MLVSGFELLFELSAPLLCQWDMGIVLEVLSKSPYEPLREASLKHLTCKTIFLLAMASVERQGELQALVFDLKYIQFIPKGLMSCYILATSSCVRFRSLIRLTTQHGMFQRSPLASQNLALLVRALRYYHRYNTEQVKKGQTPFIYTNQGQ